MVWILFKKSMEVQVCMLKGIWFSYKYIEILVKSMEHIRHIEFFYLLKRGNDSDHAIVWPKYSCNLVIWSTSKNTTLLKIQITKSQDKGGFHSCFWPTNGHVRGLGVRTTKGQVLLKNTCIQ